MRRRIQKPLCHEIRNELERGRREQWETSERTNGHAADSVRTLSYPFTQCGNPTTVYFNSSTFPFPPDRRSAVSLRVPGMVSWMSPFEPTRGRFAAGNQLRLRHLLYSGSSRHGFYGYAKEMLLCSFIFFFLETVIGELSMHPF